jgi:hypothetical protein
MVLTRMENEQLPVVDEELHAAHVWVHEDPVDDNIHNVFWNLFSRGWSYLDLIDFQTTLKSYDFNTTNRF